MWLQQSKETSILDLANAVLRCRVAKLTSKILGFGGWRLQNLAEETLWFQHVRAIQQEAPVLRPSCRPFIL